MSIIITVDNDPNTAGIQTLVEDESAGVQTPNTADTGNDILVTLTNPVGGTLGGFVTAFNTALNGALLDGFVLTDAQKVFAATNDGASSSSSFITVSTTAGETVSDLFFSDASGNPLAGAQVVGMHTLDGSNVYLWSSGNFAIATTSATLGQGQLVAAFYLNEAANHLSAQVQMVTFMPLQHPVAGSTAASYDDALTFTDVLQVSAAGSTSFDFNNLQSGDFLWVAVDGATGGSAGGAVLVTGGSPQVDSTNKITNTSDDIHVSQGGDGTTIGVNNQLFDAAGETAVFTLVKNLTTLPSGVTGAGGVYTVDPKPQDNKLEGINYSDYMNVVGSGIYISQSQGTPTLPKSLEVKLLNAGPAVEAGTNYIPGLASDGTVNVGTVTIKDDAGHVVGTWGTGGLASGTGVANTSPNGSTTVTVTISGNTLDVAGVLGQYTVDWTAASGTFNRFDVTWEAGKFDVGRVDILQGAAAHVGVGSDLVVQDSGPSLDVTATNAPSLTVDESNFAVNDTESFSAQFTPHYGTDGPAGTPLTYALSTPGGDSGLIDTLSGQHVVLSKNGVTGNIEGRTASSNLLVFVISVDASGNVTLDGQRAVVHTPDTGPDQSTGLTGSNLVVLTATAHDGDGDTASQPLDLTSLLVFKDDAPTLDVTATNAPSLTVDESNFTVNDTESFSGQFTPHYGADGPAGTPLTYALSTPGGDSGLVDTLSGQSVVLSKNAVTGNIEGRTSGSNLLVFVVSVDSSGHVTLDGQRSVVHTPDTGPDQSTGLTGSNLVVLTATAHDGDGDTASQPLDLTSLLVFKDDAPTLDVTATNAPSLTVDESNFAVNDTESFSGQFTPHYGADGPAGTPLTYALSTPGGDSGLVDTLSGQSVVLSKNAVTGNIEGRTSGSNLLVFVVSVDASGNVTLDGQRAVVHTPNTGPDQSTGLTGSNLVVLTATAHDGDGDTASQPLDLTSLLVFKDDAPSITASAVNAPSITDDESNFAVNNTASYAAQFTPTYGADGQGATPLTYGIAGTSGADSGLIESGTGNHVFLFNESGVVVGRAGATSAAAASGDIVFTVGVDGTGTVTLDQRIAVVHNPNTGPDQSTTLASAGLVVLTATAHDGDGDTAPASLNIGALLNFKDDAPTITAQIQSGSVAFATDATGTVTNNLNGSVGADVDNATQQSLTGVKEYTITSWTTPTNVFPNLNAVLSPDGTTLTYYSDAADTNAVYRLSLNQTDNSGAGSYTFAVLQGPPITQTHFDFTDLPSGQNLFGVIATNKADLTQGGLLVTPTNPVLASDGTMTNTSGTINTSKGGGPVTIGNGNQAFDSPTEGAWFMFVDNPQATAVGGLQLTQTTADDADTIKFNGVNQATDASVQIVQASGQGTASKPGPAMHITAYEANPGNISTDALSRSLVNDPTSAAANQGTAAPEINITGVKIHDSTGKVIEYRTVNQAAGATNTGTLHDVTGDGLVTGADDSAVVIQFVFDSAQGAGTADDIYSTIVSNLKAGYSIEYLTATNHDLAKVQNVSGSYDIGGFNAFTNNNVPAQHFDFGVQISDYDNDVYAALALPNKNFANFSVDLSGLVF